MSSLCIASLYNTQDHLYKMYTTSDGVTTGPVEPVDVPAGNCISYIFRESSRWAKQPALISGATGASLSYEELQEQMGRWGSWLTQWEGFEPQSTIVSVLSSLTVEQAVVQLGTMAVGGIFSGLYGFYLPNELADQLVGGNTGLVVVSEEMEPLLRKAFKLINTPPPQVVILGHSDQPVLARYQDIMQDMNIPVLKPVEISGDAVMFMLYTSGTTGTPKQIAHTHRQTALNVAMQLHPVYFHTTTGGSQTRILLSRDISLSYGLLSAFLPNLFQGACHVVQKLDEDTLLRTIARHQINVVYISPYVVPILLKAPTECPSIRDHLNIIYLAGSPLAPQHFEAITKCYPSVILQQCYGLTELYAVAVDPLAGGKVGCSGQLLPNVQIKVKDVDTGSILPPNTDGVIYIKSPCLMTEYVNNPKATREAVDEDGWFNSGDVGNVDEDGFVRIVNRQKELIKTPGAISMYPSVLENAILEHPGVANVCIVGLLQPLLGIDSVFAFVIKENDINEGSEVSEEDIKSLITKRFNKTRALHRVVFVENFPTNAGGKISRMALKKIAADIE